MTSSTAELATVHATDVTVGNDAMGVTLSDGRTITVPTAWYPRLAHATPAERRNWRLISGGDGIHWPDLDEDVSVEALLLGARSNESQDSLRAWLQHRAGS